MIMMMLELKEIDIDFVLLPQIIYKFILVT